jgi:hypothetical protein
VAMPRLFLTANLQGKWGDVESQKSPQLPFFKGGTERILVN